MSEQREHLMGVLRDFSRGMLTTRHQDGSLHTRPMVVAELDNNGSVWLMADDRSEKVAELEKDGHASLSMQSNAKYAAVSGSVQIEHDRKRIAALFKEPWKVYFPDGPSDPHIVLIKLNAERGEYWDNAGVSGIKYAWDVATAYVQGERAAHDDTTHGRAELHS